MARTGLATAIEAGLASAGNLLVDKILGELSTEDRLVVKVALSSTNIDGTYELSGEAIARILSDHGHKCSGDAVVKWRKRNNQGDE